MALKDAPIVEVLKFDETEAYDHNRPISGLIRTQLLHLHHAEQLVVPEKAQTNINNVHTELQASEYIEKITALLHKHGKGKTRSSGRKKSKDSRSKSKKKAPVSKSKKAAKSTRTRGSHR